MAFTFFFRDRHTLEQLTRYITPTIEGSSKVKIWDAGSAMGPEPYTFAIIIREAIGAEAYKKINFLATDIDENETFGVTITNAVYPHSDLSRMPENILERYFHPDGEPGKYRLNDEIRNSMKFLKHDLLTLKEPEKNFNVILCKNVLLHFQYEQRIEVFKMFHRALVPGGFLANEQTQALPKECSHLFEKVAGDANIYCKL